MQEGVAGLLRDKTRPSRIAPLGPEVAERVVTRTSSKPPGERTHWTGALMAETCGISASAVHRIWRAHGLQPHKVKQFKLSNDPKFVEKLRDVVGLYVDPPAHAIVLSFDEKSQIQALDRTQPGLPMKKGRAGTMTHDYKRNGTTTLFAALDVLEGKVIGRCMQRHRHEEFIRFLNTIEAEIRPERPSMSSSTTTPLTSIPLFWPGWRATSASLSTSRRHPAPGSTPWRAILQNCPRSVCSAASSAPSPNFKPRSSASSRRQTWRQGPSYGPPTRVKSSPPSAGGTKWWIRSTRLASTFHHQCQITWQRLRWPCACDAVSERARGVRTGCTRRNGIMQSRTLHSFAVIR